MKQQIKVFTSLTTEPKEHADRVNEFLSSHIEIVSIQNEINSGSGFSKYTARPEIVTIVIYINRA